MSGVTPTLIDYQGIQLETPDNDKQITLSMSEPLKGFVLDYDKNTTAKSFSITEAGMNWSDGVSNHTTALEKVALLQTALAAVEIPPNSTTLQLNKTLIVNDSLNTLTFDATSNEIISSGDLILNPVGSIETSGKTLNMGGGEIHNNSLIHSQNNTDLTVEGKGTGNVVIKTGNADRLLIDYNGSWTIGGGASYNNSSNTFTATNFNGNATSATTTSNILINSTGSTDTSLYPVMVSDNSTTSQGPLTKSSLVFNGATGTLSATSFLGSGADLSIGTIRPVSLQTKQFLSLRTSPQSIPASTSQAIAFNSYQINTQGISGTSVTTFNLSPDATYAITVTGTWSAINWANVYGIDFFGGIRILTNEGYTFMGVTQFNGNYWISTVNATLRITTQTFTIQAYNVTTSPLTFDPYIQINQVGG